MSIKKSKKIVETTTNRSVFNKAYKKYVSSKDGHCPLCKYNRGENYRGKHYGGYLNDKKQIVHPNWKLVSKNKKQWMKKSMNVEIDRDNFRNEKYVRFKFKRNKKLQ